MPALSIAVSALLFAAAAPAAREPVDCAREIADARELYHAQTAERLRFAAPLARTMKQVIERTLTDEDRALMRGFQQGAVRADALDQKLWPKLRRVFARFNATDCRHLGGVANAVELVDALTAMRGGAGLHTSVVVTCAQRIPGFESRRYLGLRVRADEDGPTLVLQGVLEQRELAFVPGGEGGPRRRLAIQIPLGDRGAERGAFANGLAAYTGSEAEFTWIVPARCRERLSIASP